MNCFGELLLAARTHARLTQKDLAKKVGVHDTYISKLETGAESPPSRKVALGLADALGISEKASRLAFLLAAGVVSDEDMEGLKLAETDGREALGEAQPALAGVGAFGAGVGLGAILPRNQNIGLLVEQTMDEAQLTPEQRILAESLILETARSVCEVLAKEQDHRRR